MSDPSGNVLLLGGTSNQVELHDRGMVGGKPSKYWFTFLGPPSPARERDIEAAGCGASTSGLSAILKRDHLLYTTRTYKVWCFGDSFAEAETNALAIKTQVDAARVASLAGQPSVYLVRRLYDQAAPTVWTILTGDWIPIDEELYGIPTFTVRLELLYMDGAPLLDGSGYPIAGVTSAPLVVMPTFPTPEIGGVL